MNWRNVLYWIVHVLVTPLAIAGILLGGFIAAVIVAIGAGP